MLSLRASAGEAVCKRANIFFNKITPVFEWNDKIHGTVEPWWIWVEDPDSEHIYHHETFLLSKKQKDETTKLTFTIPIFEPLPTQVLL